MAKTNKDELTKAGFKQLVERDIASPQQIEKEYQVSLGNAYDEDGKKRIALEHMPFFITDIVELEGEYKSATNPQGNYWCLTIMTPYGEKTLFMGWHESSNDYFLAIHKTVVQSGKVAGPYRLDYIERPNKPSFFKLEASELAATPQQETMAF